MLYINYQRLPQGRGIPSAMALVILRQVGGNTFESLSNHLLDTGPENDHISPLTKAVTLAYCKIRLHHLAKQ